DELQQRDVAARAQVNEEVPAEARPAHPKAAGEPHDDEREQSPHVPRGKPCAERLPPGGGIARQTLLRKVELSAGNDSEQRPQVETRSTASGNVSSDATRATAMPVTIEVMEGVWNLGCTL